MSQSSSTSVAQERLIIVRSIGLQPYEPIFARMKAFNENRDPDTTDEIWCLDHQPVFTQGQAGKLEHLLQTGDIPVIQADRGGQVTYHGPGQLIVYLMLDLRRNGLGVRDVVTMMEEGVVATLAHFGVDAYAKPDAPGVYVDSAKIASLGLRVRRGCTFHGLAFNLDMDLSPFLRINPCGYAGMPMTQLVDLVPSAEPQEAIRFLIDYLTNKIGYTCVSHQTGLD